MTSEELFKVLPVLEAMKEGKAIQYRIFENGPWEDVTEAHCVDINSYEYRVKPEADYRPFRDFFDECWPEMAKHKPFGVAVEKKSRSRVAIIFDRMRMGSDGSGIGLSWEAAFNQWEFPDGTPFGIKEEQ